MVNVQNVNNKDDHSCSFNACKILCSPLFQSGNRSTYSISFSFSYGISQSSNLTGITNICDSGNSSMTSNAYLNSFCTYPLFSTAFEESMGMKYLLFLIALFIAIFQFWPATRDSLSIHGVKPAFFRSSYILVAA